MARSILWWPAFEHVNLQTAIGAWSAREGRSVEVRGIALPPHHGGLSLQQLVAGEALPPLRLTAPALADLPNGPGPTDTTRARADLVQIRGGIYVTSRLASARGEAELLH